MVVDFRRLNQATVPDAYPLPLISQITNELAKSRWFTKLDLVGAYQLLRIAQGYEHLTVFWTQFGMLSLYDDLAFILADLTMIVQKLLKGTLAAQRISAFLQLPDLDHLQQTTLQTTMPQQNRQVKINGSFGWNSSQGTNTQFHLANLDLKFPCNEMTLIAGRVGSGKSLLLSAILGEAQSLEGDIPSRSSTLLPPDASDEEKWLLSSSSIAYVPQVSWLQSRSIRENIIFYLPLNMERYEAVVHAVGLIPDLQLLEEGDLTEIGERGKILSGGQKARVSLARALYSQASIILLDDCISAVDAHTTSHIIEHCFKSPLTKGRTIIIASHAVEALAAFAQNAVFLEQGKVVWQGTGLDLLGSVHMAHLSKRENTLDNNSSANDILENNQSNSLIHVPTESYIKPEVKAKTPKQSKRST